MKKKLNCIMLVDDDEPTNFLNAMALEELDCAINIKVIQSAIDALHYLKNATANNDETATPELIFLDVNMPAMDGWEFLMEYQQLPEIKKSKVVVVMLTTSFNPEDRLRASQIEGVSAFRNKPLDTETIAEMIEKYFPEYL